MYIHKMQTFMNSTAIAIASRINNNNDHIENQVGWNERSAKEMKREKKNQNIAYS